MVEKCHFCLVNVIYLGHTFKNEAVGVCFIEKMGEAHKNIDSLHFYVVRW